MAVADVSKVLQMNTSTAVKILTILEKEVRRLRTPVMDLHETHGGDPFRVLVGTILSARTKDQVTAEACKRLFVKVRSFKDLERTPTDELERIIYPVGFFKTKAANLKRLPAVVKEHFGGAIPETVDELVELPGVGRKTANLVVSIAFGMPSVCVDTHVHRITNRFGYVKTKSPRETEMTLRKKLPEEWWSRTNRILVAWGQSICTPIGPKCSVCPVAKLCERRGVQKSR